MRHGAIKMMSFSLRSLLLAAFVISNCITWTTSRHHNSHNVSRHRSRHRRQGQGLYLSASYVIPGGEGTGWGEWGEVSPCSRTCGGGVASQTRICLQIGPDGQPQCTGGDKKYFSCQTQDCPAGSKDFRAEQCSEYDDIAFRDIKYKWVPYTKAQNPCELNCMPRGERFYYRHKTKVIDGTRCNDESFDVCVNGTCQPVGCDMMLGSSAREDKCRECRGNGANCHTTSGLLDTQDLRKGYNDMLLIPEGATTIIIAEVGPSDNYLALRAKNGTYYLNGDYHIDFPRSLTIAGALWYYERSQQGFAAPDKLRCLGPTNEPLYLSLLLQDENVGIEYEYSVPTDMAPPQNKAYNWVHDDFTPCSASCGGGFQTRNVTCRSREELDLVDEGLCDEGLKPPTNQTCNTQPCAAQWTPGPWSKCSKRCGKGGTRSREVHCQKVITNGYASIVNDKECFDLLGPKPELFQECNENATCPTWFTGPWKPCDKLCDEGKQKRQVVCYQKNGRRIEVLGDDECEDEKPEDEQTCMLQPCDGVDWVLSEWSGCDSCLSTIRTRTAVCATKERKVVNDTFCSYHPTPVTQEPCDKTLLPPCEVQWYATQWSKCSVECGKGLQTRKVFCGLFDGASVLKVDDTRCSGQTKYNDTKECEVPREKCPSQVFAGPWTACTKKCGGGVQFRRTMCFRGGEPANDCEEKDTLETMQSCNTGPCDKDELLPLDEKSTTVMDDYDDCEDEEDYPEVGLDADLSAGGPTIHDMMFSDGTTLEGSGMSSPDFGLESEFTDSTLTTDELLTIEGSGTGSTSETFITDEYSTDTTSSGETSTSGYDSTIISSTSSDSSVSTEATETTSSEITSSTGSSEGSSPTDSSTTSNSDITTESSSTDTGSTEGTESLSTGSTVSDLTDATTSSSLTSETSDSSSPLSESTEPSGSTDSTVSGSTDSTSDGTTETGSSSETTESSATSESSPTESTVSEGSTESDTTTESGATTESGSTSVTESEGSTTESGITSSGTEETGTTESSVTTETGSTEFASTTETGSTEPTETGSTETTETGSTDTTESGPTTESGGTETTESGGTETTESGGTTETTESGSTETTESGGTETTETGSTETTESGGTTETTESGSTETTESGATETTESGGTETTETGTTESSSSESSSTEGGSTETTPWDLSTTIESYTTKKARVCRPRSCVHTEFGCCPDKKTAALGPFDDGCIKSETCKETKFGCCPDGVSPAKGPKNHGCPVEPCKETLFGCCQSDNKTAAQGNDQEGCPPPPPPCKSSKYGCCKDGETEATGPGKKGCPETVTAGTTEATKTTTVSAQSCEVSEFGCCSDNKTLATGPDQQGCTCATTEFGCCADGVTPAQGPELAGCPKSCNASTYGCCPDGKSPAHGPDQQGCCLLYSFGCCPDNHKPADGPHLEGCGCQYSRFGCCPDNITIATGPDNKGCGCEYAEHGCCPDRHTEASGPNFEGCACHTYQFGCCPDGVTTAQGPNGQGCHCIQSKYGCCGDGHTHAAGPDKQGCDCSTSKYGCCPDGTTEATGPKFLGCTDKPENKQASCNLSFERGPCRNYSVYWYFDNEYGGCSRFWYGGCDGNGNRFATKEECEDTCVSPPPKDTCKLPQSKGACLGYNIRWYFDTEREMCSNFVYGGCLGNKNNFETREACQAQCEPERALDQCNLPIEQGSCAGNFPRWGFNKESRRCEQFVWGGCEGNSNRFSTEAACLLRCNPPGQPKPVCFEEQEVGNCSDKYATWSFSQSENRCVPFYYTGCGGNGNRFDSLETCEETCPQAYEPELCTLPAETGECANYREKWYYDTKDQRCRQFYYGGCGGNGNNFASEQECLQRCAEPITTTVRPTPPPTQHTTPAHTDTNNGTDDKTASFCFLPIDPGPCTELSTRWAYDYTAGKCVSYQYGGCGGNMNNFPDEHYCQYYCHPVQDICQLPMSTGPCDESHMMWFYDAASDACSQFAYGGCEGNGNRFESREACERRCKTGPEPEPVSTTTVTPVIPGECVSIVEQCVSERAGEVWYLDSRRNECVPHQNLPQGDECRYRGVFNSVEGCERACRSYKNLDVCNYPVDQGPCQEFVSKYYFNASSGRCEEFAYGGCEGSPNRFSTMQECMDVCTPTTDPCKQPPEPGNCISRYVLWYYDELRDACNQFIYGGCGGNDNKFESKDACERRCQKEPEPQALFTTTTTTTNTPPAQQASEECVTPSSLSPCGANITAFYFNSETGACQIADHGGCGHVNTFSTEEECERRCGDFRGIDVCSEPLNPGPCRAAFPKFYFDAASGTCKSYIYGGCDGSGNRFSTEEECKQICGNAGPAEVCLAEVSTGSEGCGSPPERRWHYSPERADCIVFAYLGCGGNQNNFLSYEHCTQVCKVHTTDNGEQSPVCAQYTAECAQLEGSCPRVTSRVSAEGCRVCECACADVQAYCDALRCTYGVHRTTAEDGCPMCTCYEDPCESNNCTASEKCVVAAYRNPDNNQLQYFPQCVPDMESNEVLSECSELEAECLRLSCAYGVQRTRTSRGCERCSCVTEEVDCAPLHDECQRLRCNYGMQRTVGDDGCQRCKCLEHPCADKQCVEGERCVASPYRDPVTGDTGYSAECRLASKPGVCPLEGGGGSTESVCRRECADDADCRGVGKCCARGCAQLCMMPDERTQTPQTPDVPRAPEPSNDTEPEVVASEGGKASLRCIFHGNPPPKITWKRGEIIIDGEVDRYRVLSDGTLEIVSLYRNDSGVYICIGDNGLGVATQEVNLQVSDPVESSAMISGESGAGVVRELGAPARLRCLVYGHPEPAVYWYRGIDGPMLPFSSGAFEYEERGRTLLIRRLEVETLGEYACLAYNGHGKPATWVVVVRAPRPAGLLLASPYLLEGATPPAPTSAPHPAHTAPPTDPTTPQFTVPVETSILAQSTAVRAGEELSVSCEVDGYPEPRVHWTRDGVRILPADNMWITNTRLVIQHAAANDSGVYGCHATNGYSSHESKIQITVRDVYIPSKCTDSPYFANCNLIVQGRFCNHKYYSRFCCKSCVEAGLLDPNDVEMQADEPFRKK